jgi:hypothetical protein
LEAVWGAGFFFYETGVRQRATCTASTIPNSFTRRIVPGTLRT